jgi:hypothetical protein
MSYIRRRRIVASTESTIEIGEITKLNFQCRRADAAIAKSRIAQDLVCATKLLAENKGGERELFAWEKLVQVTQRHLLLPLRDRGNGQMQSPRFAIMSDMIARNRAAWMPPLRDCVAVSCSADSKRDEIVKVVCDKSLELRRVQRLLFLCDRAGIRDKRFNRLRAYRNLADQSVVDATGNPKRLTSPSESVDLSAR